MLRPPPLPACPAVAPIVSTQAMPHHDSAQVQSFAADPLGAAESLKEESSLNDSCGFSGGKL